MASSLFVVTVLLSTAVVPAVSLPRLRPSGAELVLDPQASWHAGSFGEGLIEWHDVDNIVTEDMPQGKMVMASVCAWVVMAVAVGLVFRSMGRDVVAQIILYITSLAAVKISVKIVYSHGFDYPRFLTAFHLLVSSLAAFGLLFRRRMVSGIPVLVPTMNELCFGIIPIALAFSISIFSENEALVFVSAAFSEVVGVTTPVVSAFLTWISGMTFHIQLLGPIIVVVVGSVVSAVGEIRFAYAGFLLLVLSVFSRSVKAVTQQRLMTGARAKFDPVTIMAWTCAISFAQVALFAAASEGLGPFRALHASFASSGGSWRVGAHLSCVVGLSCVFACALNISSLFVVRNLGAVGMQMASQLKSILVVVCGVTLLRESFTPAQRVGFVTALLGIYLYSSMQRVLDQQSVGVKAKA